jgi:hypothetical protein
VINDKWDKVITAFIMIVIVICVAMLVTLFVFQLTDPCKLGGCTTISVTTSHG